MSALVRSRVLHCAILAATYLAAARLGRSVSLEYENVTLVWLPSGVALGALLRWGYGLWPGVGLGALLADLSTGAPLGFGLAATAGNVLEPALGAFLFRAAGFCASLGRLRDVLGFLAAGVILGPMVSASIGSAALCAYHLAQWSALPTVWLQWWMGNALGTLLVGPLLLAWTSAAPASKRIQIVEVAGLALATVLVAWGVFVRFSVGTRYPLGFLPSVLLIWTAFRFHLRGATTTTALVALTAMGGSVQGQGPYADLGGPQSLLIMWGFVCVAALAGLVLAAVVTERQEAQAALTTGKAQLHLALTAGRMGTWDFDPPTGAVHWSDEVESLFRLRPGTFGGTYEDFLRLVHPSDRPQVRDRVAQALADPEAGDTYSVEYRVVPPSGEVVWHVAQGKVLRDPQGRPVRMLGTVIDITERKRTDAALRAQEERFYAYMHHCPLVACLKDADGRLVYVNPAFERAFDVKLEVCKGKTDLDLFLPETARRLRDNDAAVLAAGEPAEIEETIAVPGGEQYWLSYRFPLRGREGEVFLAAMMVEITERRRAAQQLLQSQRLEAMGALAGGIAHDFNNILSAILGFAELALLDAPGGVVRDNLGEIVHAADRAKKLVDHVLLFSRRADDRSEVFDVSRLVDDVMPLVRASLPTTIEIHKRIDPGVGIVRGDPTQIQQVVLNLCANAWHAMRQTKGVLEVTLAKVTVDRSRTTELREVVPGTYALLTVGDTGCGIPPEVRSRIFEPFFTTKPPGEGTGLGLATVHGILARHGGAIPIDSNPGRGTVCRVFLPRTEGLVGENGEPGRPPPRGEGRVLFVDDETAIVRMGRQMLESLGYNVVAHTTSNGALAAFRVAPETFAAVVTDQTMPHMTGIELATELRRIRPDIPIVLCTGFSETVVPEHVRALGISDCLMKPVSLRDLAGSMQRATRPHG